MTSEIRTNSFKSRAGLSTVTMTDSGPMFSGITTFVDNSGFTFGVGGGTSIFTPATNVLTFGTNNTEKIRIDASGHMHGVGVITATHFYGDGSNLTGITQTTINSNTNNYLITGTGTANTLQGESSLTYDGTSLKIGGDSGVSGTWNLETYNSGGDGMAVVAGVSGARLLLQDTVSGEKFLLAANGQASLYSQGAGDNMVFYTKPSGGSDTERLRITSSGYVGINQSSPQTGLHINQNWVNSYGSISAEGSANALVGLGLRANGTYRGALLWRDGSSGNYLDLLTSGAHPIVFRTNGDERLRITSGGDLLLGTSTAAIGGGRGLMIANAAGARIKLCDTDQGVDSGSGFEMIASNGGTGYIWNRENQAILFGTNETERMRITHDGSVGIGTNNSTYELEVHDGSGASALRMKDGANNVICDLIANSTGGLLRTTYSHPLVFSTNQVERVRINTHGFVKMMGDMSSHMSADGNNYHEMQADNPHIQILNMKHGSSNGYGIMMQFNHGKSTHWAFRVYNYASGSTNAFIRTDGDLENINNSYGGTSDVKLKENIVDASSQWDDIKALRVRNFNYKSDESKTKMLGLVAQEAEQVCPSLVKEQPDLGEENEDLGTTTKFMKYSIVYMKAIKALQEAQERIEKLEQENIALRVRVTNLEGN